MVERRADLQRFYEILVTLETKAGGKRRLSECDAQTRWPRRGLYFFFERGELRTETGWVWEY